MVPKVTDVGKLFTSVKLLVVVLPTATAPKLIGLAGDIEIPPAAAVPLRNMKTVPVVLLPRFA